MKAYFGRPDVTNRVYRNMVLGAFCHAVLGYFPAEKQRQMVILLTS
ncbi:MAG: hypothetical protein GY866_20280 [Proteobacteria bacterium]|nr:hypothetical protein [Pseudomonadota bacterium]